MENYVEYSDIEAALSEVSEVSLFRAFAVVQAYYVVAVVICSGNNHA